MVVWNDLDPAQRLSIYDTGVELSTLNRAERARALVSYRTGDMIAPVIDTTEALYLVMEDFAEAVRTGRAPATDGRSGLRVLEQLTAIGASRQNDGAAVELVAQEASSR